MEALREFYERSPSLPPPRVRLYNWLEVAEMVRGVYEELAEAG